MPFIETPDEDKREQCSHPEHKPPTHLYQEPGTYTWKCPACGETFTYTVPLITV